MQSVRISLGMMILAVVLSGFALLTPTRMTSAQATCTNQVDIALVLDSSSSVSTSAEDIRNFANGFVSRFTLGADATLISITVFAEYVNTTGLSDNLGTITGAIDSVNGTGSSTNIARAIRDAQGTLEGGRSVGKVLVLLSDGGNNVESNSSVLNSATNIKDAGTRIFSIIYVGTGLNVALMNGISSGGAYVAGPFTTQELLTQVDNIATLVCTNIPPAPTLRGGCLDVPAGSVVGEMTSPSRIYWAPGQVSPTGSMQPTPDNKTYWVVGVDESGEYYKIILACQYIWVPVGVMAPAYGDPVWNGTPLPTRVVS